VDNVLARSVYMSVWPEYIWIQECGESWLEYFGVYVCSTCLE
jgi:hypothetical protein